MSLKNLVSAIALVSIFTRTPNPQKITLAARIRPSDYEDTAVPYGTEASEKNVAI
jgi:hypothetical protein